MPCFHFKHSTTGVERFVPILYGRSTHHQPGEVLVGTVDTCDGAINITATDTQYTSTLQRELNDEIGGGAGDWIKALARPFARLTGKKNCSLCEARRLATNAYAKLKVKYGQLKALSIMKELWEMSFKEGVDPNDILVKLQGYLDD